MTYIVGLTGGIGSGKSAAGDEFARRGAAVIDADAIAHELTAPGGAAMTAIRTAFGADVVAADGALDRQAMRQRAFADPAARQRLEAILHPMIREETERRIREQGATAPYVVLMIPLLIEAGTYRERVRRVVVVDCPEAVQIERVMARSKLPQAEVERIMAAQATRAQRLAAADDLIDNSGDRAALARRVTELDAAFRAAAGT